MDLEEDVKVHLFLFVYVVVLDIAVSVVVVKFVFVNHCRWFKLIMIMIHILKLLI